MKTPKNAPDSKITDLTELVSQFKRFDSDGSRGDMLANIHIQRIRDQIMSAIGSCEYKAQLEQQLPQCLDPNVNEQNITKRKLDDINFPSSVFFERSLRLGNQPVTLVCSPHLAPFPRLHLAVADAKGDQHVMSLSSPDVAAQVDEPGFTEKFFYTSAIADCNGGLSVPQFRPLSNAVIQFGNGRLDDSSELKALARKNRDEYTARYLLGLPASLKEILRQAVGKNEECDTI